MLHLTVLASGSSGNCALVESPRTRLLVDAGISARQIVKRLALAGCNPLDLDGIVLTHEHGDHVCGLPVFLKNFCLPVYTTGITAETLRSGSLASHPSWRLFAAGGDFEVKDLAVQSFSVPHDAVDPVGLILSSGRAGLGFLTDLGYATKLALERIRTVHTLLIETNHDETLLQDDAKRPWSVKQRILSRHGHLSNSAAAGVVAGLANPELDRVVLGHLSRDCNTPARASEAMRTALHGANGHTPELYCATATEISPRFAVGKG